LPTSNTSIELFLYLYVQNIKVVF